MRSPNLLESIQRNFPKTTSVYFWTDSITVLRWLDKTPDQLKTFVANRVAEIQEKTIEPGFSWKWTPGSDNPADLASRGIPPSESGNNTLWWKGPSWLQQSYDHWPNQPLEPADTSSDDETELKPSVYHVSAVEPLERGPWFEHKQSGKPTIASPLLDTYGDFKTLHHAATGLIRAAQNFKARGKTEEKVFGPFTPQEKERALRFLVKTDQEQTLQKEIQEAKHNADGKSKNRPLFIDKDGLLRYYGRVNNPSLTYDEQNPVFLSPHGKMAKLLLSAAHMETLHGGAQQMLQQLRQQFWVSSARRLAKTIIHRCPTCFRYKMKTKTQLMAQLPQTRTTLTKPFTNCGVDYLGPIGVMARPGRKPLITKGYVCVFVCFATRAIHLELAGDATTQTFLAALRRMIARRGPIHQIYSDNGTNFVGANNILQEIYKTSNLAETKLNIQWHFQPPLSPHHGGLHEAAVKSVKHHIKRIIGTTNLTIEEWFTLLAQVEACVNSRPLTQLRDDVNDITALTPGHFLIGQPLITLIEPRPLLEARPSYLTRWEHTQQLFQQIWDRWHNEYLTELIKRSKWNTTQPNIKIGDLAILREDNSPPAQWPLARITEVHPGKDGLVRVVTIQTKNGTYTRPITKIAVLPATMEESP